VSAPGAFPGRAGICAQSPAVGRFLTEIGRLSFRASGFCMFPSIHPGDLLFVKPLPIERVRPGDIAVFRKGNRVLAHRVIDMTVDEAGTCLLTRSDRSGGGHDGPIPEFDLIGVLEELERKGRRFAPTQTPCSFRSRIDLAYRIGRDRIRDAAFRNAVRLITPIQTTAAYRFFGESLLLRRMHDLEYRLEMPTGPSAGALNRMVLGRTVDDIADQLNTPLPERWRIALQSAGRDLATIGFSPAPAACAEGAAVFGALWTRVSMRGLGMDRRLLELADALLERNDTNPATACLRIEGNEFRRRLMSAPDKTA
jgi:hypothetical protein